MSFGYYKQDLVSLLLVVLKPGVEGPQGKNPNTLDVLMEYIPVDNKI